MGHIQVELCLAQIGPIIELCRRLVRGSIFSVFLFLFSLVFRHWIPLFPPLSRFPRP